jgi:hypothetical protein
MPDFKKMTVPTLRELARKVIGPGHSRFKTKAELVKALEEREGKAGSAAAAKGPAVASRAGAPRRGGPAGKAAPAPRATRPAAPAKTARAAPEKAAARPRRPAAAPMRTPVEVAPAAGGAAAHEPAQEAAAEAARAPVDPAPPASRRGPRAAGADGKGRPDPEGYFVARVRGEDAVRDAPHPLVETEPGAGAEEDEEERLPPALDEHLGELPWSYGDDTFVALPRDPRTLFFYWDHAPATVNGGFEGLEHPRAQIWIFARSGEGWDRVRTIEFALESRGYYVHDLEPGRVYRAEIHAVDRLGRSRPLGQPSSAIGLPTVGPSPLVDDRFIRIPWELPLGGMLGPGHAGAPFPEEARERLAQLSDWGRFTARAWGGSAGLPGERPSSPTGAPSSPAGGFGAGEPR